jgi:rubrerythrin
MEYSAYDLYRTMAERSDEPEAAEAFMALAQAEKSHMRALADTIEKCD